MSSQEPAFEAVAPTRGNTVQQPVYDGHLLPLLRMALVNAALEAVTLGLYRFWSRASLRRHIYGRISLRGHALGYVGRGLPQFLRAMVAFFALLPFLFLAVALDMRFGMRHGIGPAGFALLGLAGLLYCRIAMFRARRYRLAHTIWRGRAFVLTGSAFRFALLEVWWLLMTLLTLGLAYPAYRMRRQRYLATHISYGGEPLEFRGHWPELFFYWLVAWLLLPWTLGLSFIWYRAREFRYFVSRTRYGTLDLRCALSSTAVLAPFLLYSFVVIAISVAGLAGVYLIAPNLLMNVGDGTPWTPSLMQAIMLLGLAAGVLALQTALIVPLFRHPVLGLVAAAFQLIGQDPFDRMTGDGVPPAGATPSRQHSVTPITASPAARNHGQAPQPGIADASQEAASIANRESAR